MAFLGYDRSTLTSLYMPYVGPFVQCEELLWALSSSNSGVGTCAIDAKVFSPIGLSLANEESNLVGTQSVTNLFTFHKKLTTTTFIIHSITNFINK